jgi:hypothetical protein
MSSNAARALPDTALRYDCSVCERPLKPVEFRDGGHWGIRGLAMRGRRRFKGLLCWDCYLTACREVSGAGGAYRRLPVVSGVAR